MACPIASAQGRQPFVTTGGGGPLPFPLPIGAFPLPTWAMAMPSTGALPVPTSAIAKAKIIEQAMPRNFLIARTPSNRIPAQVNLITGSNGGLVLKRHTQNHFPNRRRFSTAARGEPCHGRNERGEAAADALRHCLRDGNFRYAVGPHTMLSISPRSILFVRNRAPRQRRGPTHQETAAAPAVMVITIRKLGTMPNSAGRSSMEVTW